MSWAGRWQYAPCRYADRIQTATRLHMQCASSAEANNIFFRLRGMAMGRSGSSPWRRMYFCFQPAFPTGNALENQDADHAATRNAANVLGSFFASKHISVLSRDVCCKCVCTYARSMHAWMHTMSDACWSRCGRIDLRVRVVGYLNVHVYV